MRKLITHLDTTLGAVIREQLDENFEKIQDGIGSQSDENKKMAQEINKRLDEGIGALTQDSEVVIARGDFPVLDKRLAHMEDTMATKADLQFTTTSATLRRLGQKYRQQGVMASNAQGFASVSENIVVQYFQNYAPLDTDYGTLVKFDILSGQELLSKEIHGYHGNAMTYNSDDDMLYLTTANGVGSGTILKISPETLEVKEEISLIDTMQVTQVHSIGYDNVDKLYVVTDNKTIDFYDTNWQLSYTLQWLDYAGFEPNWMQGVQCNGDTLYWLGGQKSQIWVYKIDKQNQSLIFKTIYTFDDFQENLYPTGEIEGLGFNNENGKIYVASHISVSNFGGLTEYFETNADFKTVGLSSTAVPHQTTYAKPINLYASRSTNYNPDGTQNNPFASLLEATVCMRSPYIPFPSLILDDDFPDETLVLTNVNNAMFSAAGHTVKAAVIVNCDNLYMSQLNTIGWSHWNVNALYIYNSDIRINSLTANNVADDAKVVDAIYMERSKVYMNAANAQLSVNLANSDLTTTAPFAKITKQNVSSQVHGLIPMGTGSITDINNVANLSMADFLYYKNIVVRVTAKINDTNVVFPLTANIMSNTVNLIGLTQSAGLMYLCSFHYVKDDKSNTTIDFYQFPSMNKLTSVNYSIDAKVTDD